MGLCVNGSSDQYSGKSVAPSSAAVMEQSSNIAGMGI